MSGYCQPHCLAIFQMSVPRTRRRRRSPRSLSSRQISATDPSLSRAISKWLFTRRTNTTLAWIRPKLCDTKRYFQVNSFNKANNSTCQYNNVLVLLQLPGTHDDDDQVGTIDAVLGPVRAVVLLRVSTTSYKLCVLLTPQSHSVAKGQGRQTECS